MSDQRREDRFPADDPNCLDIYQHGQDFQLLAGSDACEVLNISKNGLMIRCQKSLRPQESFRLRFHFENGNELTLFGTVRWMVSDSLGGYRLGLRLEDTLGTDYLLWRNRLSLLLLKQIGTSPQAARAAND